MSNKNKPALETIHRDLNDQVNFVSIKNFEVFLESLRTLVDDLGDAIYLPDFNNIGDEPIESYSCPLCGSTNLKTILMHKTSVLEWQKTGKMNTTHKRKTCMACGHLYYVDEHNKEVNQE